ncbi:PREDICTED: glutathione S-transferase T3-like [Camelina sativa]|uniref:Glutathione S-transferase T3-like n=1 Tax=Camelina sativa TaxID=90675 RepID=A0ABM0TD76_CAMSA|nr:PREDICTED: glutathione S-transferase T3-like [Camelina sativa]
MDSDDVMLVSAWLNTSKDPITSKEQRRGAFWGRIADYVAKCPNVLASTREKSSGQNEDEIMKLAHQIFFNDHNIKFTLDHAWRELRYDQKWCASTSPKGTRVKRTRVCEDGSAHPSSSQAPIDVEDEPMMHCPTGVKAVKVLRGKAKKNINTKAHVEGDAKALLEFQMQEVERMYEMKKKDFALKEMKFAMKEKHNKHVMLENLIANKDSLTESEKALKEQFFDNMLSSV